MGDCTSESSGTLEEFSSSRHSKHAFAPRAPEASPSAAFFVSVSPAQISKTSANTYEFASRPPVAGDDPINESDPTGQCITPTNNANQPFAYSPGQCSAQQVKDIDEATATAEAEGPAQTCSNFVSCIWQNPGSIVASFEANKGTIETSVGITLGVASVAFGGVGLAAVAGATTIGGLTIGASSYTIAGLSLASGLSAAGIDIPACTSGHNATACAGAILGASGALAGGAAAFLPQAAAEIVGLWALGTGAFGTFLDILRALTAASIRARAGASCATSHSNLFSSA